MKNLLKISAIILLTALFTSCGNTKEAGSQQENYEKPQENKTESNVKVTFVELGSVNCIPCRQMQPIMKSIEEKYKGQVKVVFHDVWKDNKPAKQYGIQLIPTQVFLDENGKEFFRHEGFFAENEIIELFAAKGVVPTEK